MARQCLQSIDQWVPDTIPILLINNGGTHEDTDGMLALLPDRPNVEFVHLETMTTYGKLWNLAMRKLTTDYILLMKSFIELTDSMSIDFLKMVLDADPNVASAAPLMITDNNLALHGGVVIIRGQPVHADQQIPLSNERIQTQADFKCLSDDCLMIRRNRLFREDYLTTFQDFDWTLWAHIDGMRNVYVPSAKVLNHRGPIKEDKAALAKFVISHGGLQFTDSLNDGGTYYGGEPGRCNWPSTEIWNIRDDVRKGTITCFLADHDGCGYYRLKNPYRAMIMRGWSTMFTTWAPDEFINFGKIVVVQRACEDHMIEVVEKAHRNGSKVIYEIDDYFHGLHESNPVISSFYFNPKWLRNMEKIMYMCDAMTVSTPEMARLYGRFNTNTHIVPNHIDLGAIPNPITENTDETIRIGWGGSGTHNADIPHIVEAVTQILNEFPQTRMVFIGSDYRPMFSKANPAQMEWLPATWGHESVVEDYYKVLDSARLDIGLAPLEDTIFNRCKCIDTHTRVMTDKGILEAGDLQVGQRVYHDKAWHTIQARVVEKPTSGLLFTTYDGYQIKLTPEHRMLVDGQWKFAKDIQIDDSFLLEDESQAEETLSYQSVPWPSDSRASRVEVRSWEQLLQCEDSPTIRITPRWGKLLGAFAGDGSCNRTAIKIHCDGIDQDWIEELQADFKAIGLRATTEKTKTFSGEVLRRREVRVASANLLRVLCGMGTIETLEGKPPKKVLAIPEIIFRSPLDVRTAYIRGIFETDGTVSRCTPPSFVSKSETLARDTQRLLLSIGIVSTVKKVQSKCQGWVNTKTYWLVRLRAASGRDFLVKTGGFCSARKQAKLISNSEKVASNACKPIAWSQKIVSIEPCLLTPIDIQVEGSVFSAGGFVSHNSDCKILEYGAWGILPIASDVKPYSDFIGKNKYGFLCRNPRDWYKYLKRAIEDPQLRIEKCREAQKFVWENRGVQKQAEQIENIINDLLSGKAGHVQRLPEPVHSITVPYMNNLTSKQAHEYVIKMKAEGKWNEPALT